MRAALWVIAVLLAAQVCLSAVAVSVLRDNQKVEAARDVKSRRADREALLEKLRASSTAGDPNSQVAKWIKELEAEKD